MSRAKNLYLTDHATDRDLLRYEDFQNALHDIVTQAETPLTVGVFGPWGTGKTSLMQMVYNQIAGHSPSTRPVWFTAWKYDRHEALWRAFILRVLDALYPRADAKDPPVSWAERPRLTYDQLTDPNQKEQVKLLDRLAASLYANVAWQEGGQWKVELSGAGKEAAKLPAFMLLNLAGMGNLTKSLGVDPDLAQAIHREIQTAHMEQLNSMEQFEKAFRQAIQAVLGKNGRLIVFVDDLDRCLPEKALEVLEAIKLFLEVPGVIFILGMDQDVIRQGIEARYAAAFRRPSKEGERLELPIQGDSYLQKIVQIPFHLPALAVEDVADFIKALNPNLSERTQAVLARGVYPNPRQVKRTLNIMRLLRGVANSRFKEEAGEQIADPLLAKTVIIQSQYPKLYQLWRQYPTLVQTLETAYAQRPSSEEEILIGIRRTAERRPAAPQTGEGASPPVAGSPTSDSTGGELGEYLNNRADYLLLERLLTYPPEAETGSGADRARFGGLTRPQVEAYVRLAGAVENDPVPVDVPTDLMGDFLSGKAIKIGDAAGRLQADETEADEPLRQAVRQQLVAILSDPQQPTTQRLSAGDSLGHIGDSRFHNADGFFLPSEPLLGFVEIPAGQFRMGSDPEKDPQAQKDEQPQHSLHLDQFFMARYPVTVAQFKLFVEQKGHKPTNESSLKGLPNHPVRFVNWYEAVAYCQWLTDMLRSWDKAPPELRLKNGWSVNLPSEAEWEKAARGADARLYPWGNEFDPDKTNHKGTGLDTVSVVGCFPAGASANGLLDMSGNVREWTRSVWREYPYQANDRREDSSKSGESGIIIRGGSGWDERHNLRCAFRRRGYPGYVNMGIGLRVCLSPFLS